MPRMRAALLLVLLLLVPASGAEAVGRFGAPHRVGPSSCFRFVSAKAPDGSTHGYLLCRSKVLYVEGSGTSWRTAPAKEMPVAVAVGGTSTFSLVEGSGGLRVMRRTASGSYSLVQRLSSSVTHTHGASITAFGSKWWALWGVDDGDRATFTLWEAHTLGGTVKPRRIFDSDAYPSIAYQPSTGTAVAVWSHGGSASSTVISTSRGGAWSKPREIKGASGLGAVAVSGSTVAVVTKQAFGVAAHVGRVGGPLTTHVMSLRMAEAPLAVDLSEGKVVVAYRGLDSANAKVLQVAERVGSRWSETTLSRDRLEQVADVQSVDGQARLFSMISGSGLRVRTQVAAPAPRATVKPTPRPSPSATPLPSSSPTPRAAVTPSPTAVVTAASPTPVAAPVQPASGGGPSSAAVAGIVAGALALVGLALALVRRRRA